MTPFYYRKRQPRPWPAVGAARRRNPMGKVTAESIRKVWADAVPPDGLTPSWKWLQTHQPGSVRGWQAVADHVNALLEQCALVAEAHAGVGTEWPKRRGGDRRFKVATEIADAIRALPLSESKPADSPRARWADGDEAVDALYARGQRAERDGEI